MEIDGTLFEKLVITLVVVASGYVGGRRVVKQDNAWEKLVQSQAVEISKMREQIESLRTEATDRERWWQARLDEEQEKRIRLETKVEHLEEELLKVEKRHKREDTDDSNDAWDTRETRDTKDTRETRETRETRDSSDN